VTLLSVPCTWEQCTSLARGDTHIYWHTKARPQRCSCCICPDFYFSAVSFLLVSCASLLRLLFTNDLNLQLSQTQRTRGSIWKS
jgi:hypothetical protein